MTLLEVEHVGQRHRRGTHERVVLRDVSLELDSGELVAIWGLRRSGRSTLLRIAAGIEPPDAGAVRFAGRDLARDGVLGSGIGYCWRRLGDPEAGGVLDELVVAQLAWGVPLSTARSQALAALERVGAEQCDARVLRELDTAETMRVMVARALVLQPSLLVIDEPTAGVDLLARDGILSLLRSLADEGIAVLTSTGEATALSGADRALSLTEGDLRGSFAPELAPVVPLRRRASA
ncbi:MAG: ATP-binding cassette domain-containing protein [Solirubrobacteraceae bacterium]